MSKRKSIKRKLNFKIPVRGLALTGTLAGLAVIGAVTLSFRQESARQAAVSAPAPVTQAPAAQSYEFAKYKVAQKPVLQAKKAKKKMIAKKKNKRSLKVARK